MKYEVLFTPTAQSQALAAAEYIAERSPKNAVKWYKGIEKANRQPVDPAQPMWRRAGISIPR